MEYSIKNISSTVEEIFFVSFSMALSEVASTGWGRYIVAGYAALAPIKNISSTVTD